MTTPGDATPDTAAGEISRLPDRSLAIRWPNGRPRVCPCQPEVLEELVAMHNKVLAALFHAELLLGINPNPNPNPTEGTTP